MAPHRYSLTLEWTGNRGTGTRSYRDYDRSYDITIPGKPVLAGSSDPAFRGDASLYNPEDLFVAALSSCHMLWYLHLCAVNGIVVTGYQDRAEGEMVLEEDGSGRFVSVTLRPQVTLTPGANAELAERLHAQANAKCFIANSVSCPVHHEAEIIMGKEAGDGALA